MSRVPKNKLTKEIVNERLSFSGRGVKLVGEYINANHKSDFMCSKGHIWTARPGSVLSGKGCPDCAGNRPRSLDSINEELARNGRGIRITGELVSVSFSTEFSCKYNHKWNATPNSVLKGSGCPHCSRKAKLSKKEVNKRLSITGSDLTMVGEYKNVFFKSEFLCKYGHTFLATPNGVLRGNGCPHCYGVIDSIYIWESEGEIYNGKRVYKIGVTKSSRGFGRIKQCEYSSGKKPRILRLEKVKDASGLEGKLLEFGEKPEYLYKFDGYSEMRALDGEEITEILKLIDESKETINAHP